MASEHLEGYRTNSTIAASDNRTPSSGVGVQWCRPFRIGILGIQALVARAFSPLVLDELIFTPIKAPKRSHTGGMAS